MASTVNGFSKGLPETLSRMNSDEKAELQEQFTAVSKHNFSYVCNSMPDIANRRHRSEKEGITLRFFNFNRIAKF